MDIFCLGGCGRIYGYVRSQKKKDEHFDHFGSHAAGITVYSSLVQDRAIRYFIVLLSDCLLGPVWSEEGEKMSFTSLCYFPVLGAVAWFNHFLSPRYRHWFLLAVSWYIYALFGIQHFLLLLFVTGISYFSGRWIAEHEKRKRFVLAGGIIIIVSVLFFMKYLDMFLSWMGTAAGIFGHELTFPERYIVLPAGISFYTFQSLSYLINVYRGEGYERNFVRYALYLSFFPQLVAGPIEQAENLIPQLRWSEASKEDVLAGISCILSGCVRKFVIADYMAVFVDEVYGNVMGQSGVNLLFATVLFAIQIYGDFSGYTHIAAGSARLLGIQLTENFDRPYLAVGCRDFWKRWHITLTRWFTKYVYIPLGGSRRGEIKKYINIMIVFLLSGLWHGADLTFLCWGAFFGIWRITEEIVMKKTAGRTLQKKKICPGTFLKRAGTFAMVCLSWVFFRSQSVSEAAEVLRRIFTLKETAPFVLSETEIWGAAVRIGILALLPGILQTGEKGGEEPGRFCYIVTIMTFLITVCIIFLYNTGSESSFIYFRF